MSVRARVLLTLFVGLALTVGAVVLVKEGAARYTLVVSIFLGMAAVVAQWAASPVPPELEVTYCNLDRDLRLVLDARAPRLTVFVENRGKGPAEVVEVRFDSGGAQVFNESGNSPDRTTLDLSVTPPRFLGRDRVLNPGEKWPVALLAWWRYSVAPTTPLNWTASAKGMPLRTGAVEIDVTHEDEDPWGEGNPKPIGPIPLSVSPAQYVRRWWMNG